MFLRGQHRTHHLSPIASSQFVQKSNGGTVAVATTNEAGVAAGAATVGFSGSAVAGPQVERMARVTVDRDGVVTAETHTLSATIEHVPSGIPVIVDAKVGDIGSTAERYAAMFFDGLGADALTVNPYMGSDAVAPFVAHGDRGVFLVCLTSNPGAVDFEKQALGAEQLYERVARRAVEWNERGNCGLVVGATQPEAIEGLRAIAGDMPFLVPGVGAQAGDLASAVRNGVTSEGRLAIVNSSRGVLYASEGPDFARAARQATEALRKDINQVLSQEGKGWS